MNEFKIYPYHRQPSVKRATNQPKNIQTIPNKHENEKGMQLKLTKNTIIFSFSFYGNRIAYRKSVYLSHIQHFHCSSVFMIAGYMYLWDVKWRKRTLWFAII